MFRSISEEAFNPGHNVWDPQVRHGTYSLRCGISRLGQLKLLFPTVYIDAWSTVNKAAPVRRVMEKWQESGNRCISACRSRLSCNEPMRLMPRCKALLKKRHEWLLSVP
jgi:ferredoxin